jgi:cytosine/adenosine deaminase-related metal-dependent hydrolase
LDEWLKTIEAEQSQLTPEQARVGALATYAEALLSGTTTIMDMCLHPDQAFAAACEIGIRAVIAPYVADRKSFTPTLADTAKLIETASRQMVACAHGSGCTISRAAAMSRSTIAVLPIQLRSKPIPSTRSIRRRGPALQAIIRGRAPSRFSD